mmetsp:Transcript_10208/g.16523  ORF Transcript_10208/g.16523 Transcript_10208/m.16523 type:complete len:171 (+) Transcript_10208:129-641(+)
MFSRSLSAFISAQEEGKGGEEEENGEEESKERSRKMAMSICSKLLDVAYARHTIQHPALRELLLPPPVQHQRHQHRLTDAKRTGQGIAESAASSTSFLLRLLNIVLGAEASLAARSESQQQAFPALPQCLRYLNAAAENDTIASLSTLTSWLGFSKKNVKVMPPSRRCGF